MVRSCSSLRRLEQHDLPVGLGDGHVLDEGEPACDQSLLDRIDDLVHVENDLVALDRDGSRPFARQDPVQRLLGPGVDPHPQVGELVGGDELPDLAVDQAVDGRRQRPDQLLQARPVGDHPGEDVVEDGLDVDLLLDRIGDLGGDDVLHLGRGDERIHRGDVALGVVQRALAPVRHGRRHGQQPGQHDADHRGDRATTRGSFRCCHRFDRAAGGTRWRELRHGVSVRLELASGAPALGPVSPFCLPSTSHAEDKFGSPEVSWHLAIPDTPGTTRFPLRRDLDIPSPRHCSSQLRRPTISSRPVTWHFLYNEPKWPLTVRSEMASMRAICLLARPSTSNPRISDSRGLRPWWTA